MQLHETEALVLRVRPYGELDLLLTFYSKEKGKITGLARAAQHSRKRFGGRVDLCSHVRLHYQEKNISQLLFLAQTELICPYQEMKKDLVRSAYASFMCELVLNLVAERDVDPLMFEKLIKIFNVLDQKNDFMGDIFCFYWWFLKRIGLSLVLSTCMSCKQVMDSQEGYFFSFLQGGVLCHKCEKKNICDGSLDRKSYDYLKSHCDTTLEMSLCVELEKFFHAYFLFNHGKPFRSFNYLQEMRQFS